MTDAKERFMNAPRGAGSVTRHGPGVKHGPVGGGSLAAQAGNHPPAVPSAGGDLDLGERVVQQSRGDTSVATTLVRILGFVDAAIAAEKSRSGGGDPAFVLGMTLTASRAANLLPEDWVDEPLSPGEKAPVAPYGDPLLLLRAAEELTREHEVEDFPPGISSLVVSLIDLIRDWTP